MKFTLRTLSLIVVTTLVFAVQSFATSLKSVTTATSNESISLKVAPDFESQLQVQIYDTQGKILMSEIVKTKDIKARSYNLKNLPYGQYFMKIEGDKEILTKRFKYEDKAIFILDEKTVLKPVFYKKDYIWTLSLLTFGKDATVKIYDDFGREIYSENFINQESISRKYNLSKQNAGEYLIKVFVDDKSFYDRMIIN